MGDTYAIAKWTSSSGLELGGILADYEASSTRLEIAAATVSMASPQPMLALADSAAFLTKATAIIAHTSKEPKKPWPLCKNGDLWCVFQELAVIREDTGCGTDFGKQKGTPSGFT